VMLAGYVALGLLSRLGNWSWRRDLLLAVLAAPVVSLALGIASLRHIAGRVCFLGAPPWDYRLGVAVPLAMALVALIAAGIGLGRLVLMARAIGARGVPAGPELEAIAGRLARRLGVRPPRVWIHAHDRPIAITHGLLRPAVVLSSWMVDHLDAAEIESVLAHELGHVARRDYHLVWLATVLRDAFFYLPSSRAAYHRLQRDKEPACDDLAVAVTGRPLALASALAKVWHERAGGALVLAAQPLTGTGPIEDRITRLLDGSAPPAGVSGSWRVALAAGLAGLGGLLALQAAGAAVLLTPMGCGPGSPLGGLF